MDDKKIKLRSNIISAAGLILTLLFFVWCYREGLLTDRDKMTEFFSGFPVIGPVVFIIIQIVQVIFPVIPGALGCAVGVTVFGPAKGFIYNYTGICIGSVAVFLIAKKYGRELMCKMFSSKLIGKYDDWTKKDNRFTKLFATAIFAPVAPDDFLCYLAGTTTMKLRTFVIIILLGKPLAIAIYSMGLDFIIQSVVSLLP